MDISFFSLLGFGFLLGIKHAVEADHVMAVASFTVQAKSWQQSFHHGITWGIGHTTTLFIFSLFVFLADSAIPEKVAHSLEFVVGIMLVVLGINLLLQMRKKRIHAHIHDHAGGQEHAHFHSHLHDSSHDHQHLPLWKTLYIGLIHGMAGSAALILLTLSTVDSVGTGLLYVLCFGIGSVAGMGVLSAILVVPFLYAEKHLQGFHKGLQWSTSLGTILLGIYIMMGALPFL